MKKFFEEFKEFINQGNVMDLAVAVVIGTAFTAIVNSVVSDLIMPLISLVTGGIDFSDMKIPLGTGPMQPRSPTAISSTRSSSSSSSRWWCSSS